MFDARGTRFHVLLSCKVFSSAVVACEHLCCQPFIREGTEMESAEANRNLEGNSMYILQG